MIKSKKDLDRYNKLSERINKCNYLITTLSEEIQRRKDPPKDTFLFTGGFHPTIITELGDLFDILAPIIITQSEMEKDLAFHRSNLLLSD